MLVKSGYAPINDLKLYYEIHGSGQQLVLVYGDAGQRSQSQLAILPNTNKI
ncbi:hypothetical protein [Herpetosiphon geysericola]|uniref:hypothetical protein n=1 Tax=Herpetosiphon geysericola TaxID=70996 RepID=UPI001364D27B|nr:hypothetical protein [Herpetosiphon geysericola]